LLVGKGVAGDFGVSEGKVVIERVVGKGVFSGGIEGVSGLCDALLAVGTSVGIDIGFSVRIIVGVDVDVVGFFVEFFNLCFIGFFDGFLVGFKRWVETLVVKRFVGWICKSSAEETHIIQ